MSERTGASGPGVLLSSGVLPVAPDVSATTIGVQVAKVMERMQAGRMFQNLICRDKTTLLGLHAQQMHRPWPLRSPSCRGPMTPRSWTDKNRHGLAKPRTRVELKHSSLHTPERLSLLVFPTVDAGGAGREPGPLRCVYQLRSAIFLDLRGHGRGRGGSQGTARGRGHRNEAERRQVTRRRRAAAAGPIAKGTSAKDLGSLQQTS